jgi:hypothetical protein
LKSPEFTSAIMQDSLLVRVASSGVIMGFSLDALRQKERIIASSMRVKQIS